MAAALQGSTSNGDAYRGWRAEVHKPVDRRRQQRLQHRPCRAHADAYGQRSHTNARSYRKWPYANTNTYRKRTHTHAHADCKRTDTYTHTDCKRSDTYAHADIGGL